MPSSLLPDVAPERYDELIRAAAGRFGLSIPQIKHDYHLVRMLQAISETVGGRGELCRAYGSQKPVGRLVFGGGTALSSAWDIAPRYSEDIDMIFIPYPGVKQRVIKKTLKHFLVRLADNVSAHKEITDRGFLHLFATLHTSTAADIRLDFSVRDVNYSHIPIFALQPVSLIGRTADAETYSAYPEIGALPSQGYSWEMSTIHPASIAMDKLLTQASLSLNNDTDNLHRRARDLYDLALIAKQQELYTGTLKRDASQILWLAQETQNKITKTERPLRGFGSLESFRSGSPQNEVLRDGYQRVIDSLVWGEKLELDEAIELAVSLDPGPAEKIEQPTLSEAADGIASPGAQP